MLKWAALNLAEVVRMFVLIHGCLCALVAIHVVFRVVQLVRLKKKDSRRFWLFWSWPLVFVCQRNLVPFWQTNAQLADATSMAICFAILLDFFYYYIVKSQQWKQQVISFVLPLLFAVGLWFATQQNTGQVCVLPHTGRYQVWTEPLIQPQSFYFMRLDKGQVYHADSNRDPNYARGIFAPFSGRVSAINGAYIQIEGEQATVEIGPFLSDTVRVKVDQAIFVDQPLGLSGRDTDQPPGVRLRHVAGEPLVFRDFFGGRWLGFRYQKAQPGRNWYVTSDSKTRFRVDSESRETQSRNPR